MASNDDIYSRLGSLEGTMQTFIAEIRERRREHDEKQVDQENRLRRVESRQTWLAGVASGLSLAFSAAGYLLSAWLHSKFGQPSV